MMTVIKGYILRILNTCIRKNELITRLIFGITIPSTQEIHWDFTTLVLKYAVARIVRPNDNVLDMGTGPYALLAIFISKKGIRNIQACDINQHYIAMAHKVAAYNHSAIDIIPSDLFAQVKNKFDLIIFNAVYIPKDIGISLSLPLIHMSNTHWCGGDKGTETIDRFLQHGSQYLRNDGKILLGFNPHYVSIANLFAICKKYNYNLCQIVKYPLLPSLVFILKVK